MLLLYFLYCDGYNKESNTMQKVDIEAYDINKIYGHRQSFRCHKISAVVLYISKEIETTCIDYIGTEIGTL